MEFGAGATTKVRLLLEHREFGAYVPVDISGDFLNGAGRTACGRISPPSASTRCAADFTTPFALPDAVAAHAEGRLLPGLDASAISSRMRPQRSCAAPARSSARRA